MCDSIANGGPISFASTGGGGSCPPANVIVASNVLATNGNVIAGNVISQDGTFTGNLYVAGQIIGTIIYNTINIADVANLATVQAGTIQAGLYSGNGSGLSNLNASNLAFGIVNSALIQGNTLSNIQFSNIVGLLPNTISNLNASNLSFGIVNSSLIYGNTLSNIQFSNIAGLLPNTISNLNASNLAFGIVNSALIQGNTISNIQVSNISGYVTGNVLSNLNASNLAFGVVNSALIYGNALSNISGSNVVGNVANATVSLVVSQASQPNITSVGTLTSLTVSGTTSSGTFSGSGSGLTNIPGASITGTVQNAVVAQVVSQASQPNITSVGTLTSLSVTGTVSAGTFSGSGASLTNVPGSSIDGTVGTAQSVTNASQSNITSLGTLTGLAVSGLLTASNGSAISNLNASNVVLGTLPTSVFPTSGVTAGPYGSASNVAAVTIDQYGRVTTASNVTITSSQWSGTPPGPIYYANYVGIGSSATPTANLQVTGNVYASNSVTTTNVYFTNQIQETNLPTSGVTAGTYGSYANVSQVTIDQYGRVTAASNVTISSSQWTTVSGNVAYQNGVSIGTLSNPPNGSNLYVLGTATFTNIAGNGSSIFSLNSSNLVGNVANANVALVVSQASQPNITSVGTLTGLAVNGLLIGSNASGLANISGSNVTGNVANATVSLVVSQASQPNITSVGILTSLNVSTTANIATLVTPNISATTANVGTLNVISISNLNSLTLTSLQSTIANVGTLNVLSISNLNSLTTNLVASTANVGSLNVLSISNLNSLTTNLLASSANVGTLNVSGISNLSTLNAGSSYFLTANITSGLGANTAFFNVVKAGTSNAANIYVSNLYASNLTVVSNILPGFAGNTYMTGNLVVFGNVFSTLGELGAGGGYYLSLPTNIAVQPGYNGPVYGTAYPFSVGLSNGFTINGTSTLITITTNGNFKFSVAGPYILNAVFNSSDNITGLAVGSNVADIHGQDQNYLYRYTTFVSQNPTEVIEIPINVTDATLYYYLDIFKVDQGTIYSSNTGTGGTWLTITPLTGGGLATGGPGGTPGTQWISSGSNIYFPNSVGVGTVNPVYNLDVSTGNTATQTLITSNISSLGIHGPILNIASNVLIQSNLAVGGGVATTPPYALYVTGQGYFSQHVTYDNFAGFRNRLINGTFRIASRNNTLTISNTSSFSLSNSWVMDRWYADTGNLSTSNVSLTVRQDSPSGPNNGFSNVANVYVSRPIGGVYDNTWLCPLVQPIESSGTYDLRFGQPTAKPMVLSFTANTTVAGNYSVVLRSKADNTYFANLVTLGTSFTRYTVYVPACTIGTWGQSTAGSVEVCLFGLSFGSTRANVAPTTSWTASPGYAPVGVTGATNWLQTTGAFIQVTGVQLELGTIATPFEIRLVAETIRLSQRYYESNQQLQYAAALGSGRVNSIPFVVTKRANANVSVYRDLSNLTANTNVSQFVAYYGDGALKGTQAITSYLSSQYGFSFNFTNTGSKFMDASIMEAQFVWQADAEIY
jgi:hypothetical protein